MALNHLCLLLLFIYSAWYRNHQAKYRYPLSMLKMILMSHLMIPRRTWWTKDRDDIIDAIRGNVKIAVHERKCRITSHYLNCRLFYHTIFADFANFGHNSEISYCESWSLWFRVLFLASLVPIFHTIFCLFNWYDRRYEAESRYLCVPSKDDVFKLLVGLHESRNGNMQRVVNFCNRKRPAKAIFTNIRFLG